MSRAPSAIGADTPQLRPHVRKHSRTAGDLHATKEPAFAAAKAEAVNAATIFHARVPELTASAGIKLNERHPLQGGKSRIR
jgi:hypothetical protein